MKLGELNIEVNDANRAVFQGRLDCMYHMENRILELAQNPSWNTEKIQNFIFDQNQTAYLGAEGAIFVTRDNEILDAAENSIQKDRVFSWTDFLAQCSVPMRNRRTVKYRAEPGRRISWLLLSAQTTANTEDRNALSPGNQPLISTSSDPVK